MMQIPKSESTRQRALSAVQSLGTDELLRLTQSAPVAQFYKRQIAEALERDFQKAQEWMPKEQQARVPESLGSRPSTVEISSVGSKGPSAKSNTGPTVRMFSNPNDTLSIPTPKMRLQHSPSHRDLMSKHFGDPQDYSNDTGGDSAYG